MKKLLIFIFMMIFVVACHINIEPTKIHKPLNIFIDEFNNGIISYSDGIHKINDLSISNFSIGLFDKDFIHSIDSSYYSVDNNGNGILVYSRNINDNPKKAKIEKWYDYKHPFYSVKISNHEFNGYFPEHISDSTLNILDFISISQNNYALFYDKVNTSGIFEYNVFLKKSKDNKAEDFLFQKGLESGGLVKITINEKGNGWILNIYDGIWKFSLINNYSIEKEIKNSKISAEIYNIISVFLDSNGTGKIVFSVNTNEDKKIYLQKFDKFEVSSEKEVIGGIENVLVQNNHIGGIQNLLNQAIYINEKGSGLAFFYKEKSIEDSSEYMYMKKITNFKLEDKETKLDDSDRYNYYSASINKNGNGIMILKDKYDYFVFKKIRNYELEKPQPLLKL